MQDKSLPDDEVVDTATNYLASMTSIKNQDVIAVNEFLEKAMQDGSDDTKTYEYYFNLS